jgi:hypothetical protein
MNSNAKQLTYNESEVYWKKYQRFFPEELQITEDNLPFEEWFIWKDYPSLWTKLH